MEPMTLGSPVASPPVSTTHNPLGTAVGNTVPNTFYPSYLLGESPANAQSVLPHGGRVPLGNTSPTRPSRTYSTSISSPAGSPQPSREAFFPNRIGSERQAGPPTMSLIGGLPQSPNLRMMPKTFIEQQKIVGVPTLSAQSPSTPGASHSLSSTLKDGMFSASFIETHCENPAIENLEEPWVTIFGFLPSSASYILTQFAQLGTIVDQRQPGSGNWMHLKYQTKLQARKALSKNGKIFNGSIMVGVTPCTDKTIIGEKENLTLDYSAMQSPRDVSLPTTPKSHIRPLTQAYQASRADLEVTPKSNTPKKNESIVSKAIQHILGV